MITDIIHTLRDGAHDSDADIDHFLADNHEEIAAKLAAGRDQILRGLAVPLEPLEALLSEARARR